MKPEQFNTALLEFLHGSPTPFHAVQNMTRTLNERGYTRLFENETWELDAGGRYYVVRNGSSLIAFTPGQEEPAVTGIRMIGAHTDSPCLRLKPRPEIASEGYSQLALEVYGAVLLNPWFDRDLSIAGRVTFRDHNQHVASALVDFKQPVAMIPSLAIHLDREANNQRAVNPQKDMPAILMPHYAGAPDLHAMLLARLTAEHPGSNAEAVLDFELSLYDTQPPALCGINHEFIASARLDNLLSCYTGLQALLASDGSFPALLVCNDHEEVGSMSASGAQGPFLRSCLQRWCVTSEGMDRSMDRSIFISADNAHGIHPNYADRHDRNHGPILNKGPVIKYNTSQRYATTSETAALFRQLCATAGVPVQHFVARADTACGSTIGPLTATTIGVRTLDVGVPQLAMHSIRELCGARDAYYLFLALRDFFNEPEITAPANY